MAIKYKWIAECIRSEIEKGYYAGNDRLPTEEDFRQRFDVSRQTIRQALTLLEQEGVIEKRQGAGSFITGLSQDVDKNQIAILLTSSSDYLYPGLAEDLKSELALGGFNCHFYITGNRVDRERQILEQLTQYKPAGIIVEGCKSALPNPNLDLYRRLMQSKIPVLFLHNYYFSLNGITYIKDNNYQGSSALVQHLFDHGHREIAGFFPSDDVQGLERYQGYADTLRLLHLPLNDDHVGWFHRSDIMNLEQNQNTSFIRRFIEEVLNKGNPPCTAVVCYNDEIAYYLLKEFDRLGIKVPETIAITSFDNSYLAMANSIGLTSLSHQSHEMGRKAAQMMIDMKKGLPVPSKELPWMIRARESS